MKARVRRLITQEEFAGLPDEEVFLVAPAGCGKTEALAMRADSLRRLQGFRPPRKILALTFSNRARTNLKARLRRYLGATAAQTVTVHNFHGLGARIIRAHGEVVGLSGSIQQPDRVWREAELRRLGIGYRESSEFERALRVAKFGAADDDEVLRRLQESGHTVALEFEMRLRAEGRIDFDDQIRHALRVLADPRVARLYVCHFAATLVDEVQDLSLDHLRLAQYVTGGPVTYCGDPAQGIYSFAGAQPREVFSEIRSQSPIEVEFGTSYRSSPAVLRAVSATSRAMGGGELICARPDDWPHEGNVVVIRSRDTEQEAEAVLDRVQPLLDDGRLSVGVLVRRGSRGQDIRTAAEGRGIVFQDWGAPTHVPRVVELLKRHVSVVSVKTSGALERLQEACSKDVDAADTETLGELRAACVALGDLVEDGMSLEEAVARCRASPDPEAPVAPGLHVLTGHMGKGQEFDCAVILGMEDGHIPDFRNTTSHDLHEELRVLHVMVSRARRDLIVTVAERTRTRFGRRRAEESRWLSMLEAVRT